MGAHAIDGKSAPRRPQVLRQVQRLLALSGPWAYLLYAAALCGVVVSVAGVVSADLVAKLINAMMAQEVPAFTALVVPLILVNLGETVVDAGRRFLAGRLGHETAENLRRAAADRMCRATAASMSGEHSGQVLSKVSNDMTSTQSLVEVDVPTVFTGMLRASLAIAYMLWKDWLLALIAVFGTPLVFFIVSKLNGPVMTISRQGQEKLAEANRVTTEALAGAEVVRSYCLQNRLRDDFSGHVRAWLGTMARLSRLSALAAALGFGASFTPFLLIFGVGGFMVLRGRILMGTLLAFVDLLNYVSFPMQELPRYLNQMATNAASAERVLDLLGTPVEPEEGREFPDNPDVPALELRDVTFTYPGASAPSLSGVSLTVRCGETLAIAGASGTGKTTLFRLLLRDYEPDSGVILLLGHPLGEWSVKALRDRFSCVSQETYLFPFSVAENLVLGRKDVGPDGLLKGGPAGGRRRVHSIAPAGIRDTRRRAWKQDLRRREAAARDRPGGPPTG